MTPEREKRVSKFLSLVLRHEPEKVGLTLGEGGWVSVFDLIQGADRIGFNLSIAEIDHVVRNNDKQRFSLTPKGMIRANQGHSVQVDLQLEPATPPDVLFHGTVARNLGSIWNVGLLRGGRHHVHLSADVATAAKVGSRRGKAVVLRIDAVAMASAGHRFYVSANGVWLTDHVPPGYIQLEEESHG